MLKLWMTCRTRSALVELASAIVHTGMPCADSKIICARRQVTPDPLPTHDLQHPAFLRRRRCLGPARVLPPPQRHSHGSHSPGKMPACRVTTGQNLHGRGTSCDSSVVLGRISATSSSPACSTTHCWVPRDPRNAPLPTRSAVLESVRNVDTDTTMSIRIGIGPVGVATFHSSCYRARKAACNVRARPPAPTRPPRPNQRL